MPRPNTATYGKVASEEEGNSEKKDGVRSRQTVIAKAVSAAQDLENDPAEARRQMVLNGMGWIWKKMQAAFWVAAACGMIWWTNFFRVIWEHPDVNKVYFYLALGCLAFVMSLLWYLSMWLPMMYGKDHAWEDDHPKIIPVMTVASLCMSFFFFLAFWRVWGFLTFLLQFVLFLGFVSSAQFLPGGHLGVICMFVIFFGSWFTSEMIPHKGLAHYTPKGLGTIVESPDMIVP
mmetsp:Transcript_6021/g.13968  ORF Transcript_6021/g.13968 Transcript_6021/m.13968 type:complete len:232 (-) Transcript_6021:24-719(-)